MDPDGRRQAPGHVFYVAGFKAPGPPFLTAARVALASQHRATNRFTSSCEFNATARLNAALAGRQSIFVCRDWSPPLSRDLGWHLL
jgi:hypothetical protein